MSKNLSLAAVLEKNKLSSDVALLALLDVEVVNPDTGVTVTTLRIVNNPDSVVFQGNTYTAGGFDFEVKAESGKQPEVQMSIVDFTRAIQTYMQQYGGGVGSKVTLYIVGSDRLTQPPELVEYFEITAASAAGYVATFTLGAENSLARSFPRRLQRRDFCQWRYKSAECGYAGAMPSCDLTLSGANGCGAHNNTPNYGAYPGLMSNGSRYF